MEGTHARRRTPRAVVGAAFAAAILAGCGGDEFANDERSAEPITVSAVITPRGISASPSRFGAGTIELKASNQTENAQRVRLRSDRWESGGSPLEQTTGPISPGGVATLKADVDAGTYVLSASPRGGTTQIIVGKARESTQDRALQP